MRKPRLTMDGFMEAQDFDRTRGNAIGASDRSTIDAQLDIILGLEARVAELEALASRLEDAMTPEQLADFNRPVMSRSPT